jgi:outer membrane protein TolC
VGQIYPGASPILGAPIETPSFQPPQIRPARPAESDIPLPINLATALYLSNARPLVIASAQASVEEAAARLRGAEMLWLPNLNFGGGIYRHDGLDQSTDGTMIYDHKTNFDLGGGASLDFEVTDAIFRPLADRQDLAAREADLQSAQNDALLATALAYFDVQQARGTLAGVQDAVAKGRELVKRATGLARGLVAEVEVNRARAQLFDLQQQEAAARANWRIASARLTRVLRLNPGAVVVPAEVPYLQITLISPQVGVGELIPIGLTSRPELASQRATVAANCERVRQEQYRPLLPSLVARGPGPGGVVGGGFFGGGPDAGSKVYGGRFDAQLGLVWTLENLGAGNRARVGERVAQEQRATIDFANAQDQVAQDVVQAHAILEAANIQVERAAAAIKEALISYNGTLVGIGETRGAGGVLQLVNRPQEAVASLIELNRTYDEYFVAVNDYNRAQFQLYRALGYPARVLACDRPIGPVNFVDGTRPAGMMPTRPVAMPER